ncbi:hypothetical protein Tcan_05072 [Toxocara canis]|uniref:Uncharacterized protein n=1 Tax=Toxocara canis TaxID=6265 RepID=A0A0B2V0T4_TOXCA|nr:hypothetical protein Tcan_05072 [Toxocara canis]
MGDYFTAATEQIKSSGNEFMDEFTVGRNLVKGSWELQRVQIIVIAIGKQIAMIVYHLLIDMMLQIFQKKGMA